MKKHLRIHSGQKPYPCNQCAKALSQSDDLKKHFRIHSGEKIYPCNQCPKAFSESGSLKKHLRTHSGKNHILVINVLRPSLAVVI